MTGSHCFRAALTIAALVLAAGCAQPDNRVHSDRPGALTLAVPQAGEGFQFAVFGDRTGGPAQGIGVLAQAVRETNLLDPDLVMTVGDLVEGYNETPLWLEQMREYRATMDGLAMPWYPVAGNHDVYWRGGPAPPGQHEANYESHFGPLWYWFGHKNAAFIVLYTDEGDRASNTKGFPRSDLTQMSAEQLAWLEHNLDATRSYDHVFVFVHHPRWIDSKYPGSNWDAVHRLLVGAGNVSAVFAGHLHRQRYDGQRDGIAYHTLATSGGWLPMDVPGSGWLHHLNLVTVRPDGIEVAALPVGATIDPKAMTPEHLRDIDLARSLPVTQRTERLDLGIEGSAHGRLVYLIENPAARAVEMTVTVQQASGDWLVRPPRRHIRIEPGDRAEVVLDLERPGDDFRHAFSPPRVSFQVDYLTSDRHVRLPAAYRFAPVRPVSVAPPDGPTPPDQALLLDGTGAALWFDSGVAQLGDGPLTLETWFAADGLEGSRALLAKGTRSAYGLYLEDGRPAFLLALDGTDRWTRGADEVRIGPDQWHHLAGVYDGQEMRLYLDGRLIAREPAAGARGQNDRPLYVGAAPGADGGPTRLFAGRLDEVRLSTTARYAGEGLVPAPRHAPDAVTALLLHLDRDDGPFVFDASPHRRHGIGTGALSLVPR